MTTENASPLMYIISLHAIKISPGPLKKKKKNIFTEWKVPVPDSTPFQEPRLDCPLN